MAARLPGDAPLPETIDSTIDETAPPQRSPLRGALPFGPPRPDVPAAPRPGPRVQQAPSGEETAPPMRSPLAAALPFRRAKPTASTMAIAMPTAEDLRRLAGARSGPPSAPLQGPKGLSLEQYAALCAELAVFPDASEVTFVRYGLGDLGERSAADIAWQERLRADPAQMQRWQSLYLHYHEHYSQPGGR